MSDDATSLYEYIKGLLKYVGADDDYKNEPEDQAIIDLILSIERTHGTKEMNGCKFKSVEEIMKHLKQAADEWHSKQLRRIAREHDYFINSTVDENNNESSSNNPSGKVYNLRKAKKSTKDKDHIYY